MSQLFSPVRIGKLELENRIVIAPMCQYSADNGKATAWHRIHLGQLAFSGAGLLIIEASAVEPAGRITPADMGLWDDETEAALHAVLKDIRQYSSIPIGIQLGHAGRKASSAAPGWGDNSWHMMLADGTRFRHQRWPMVRAIVLRLSLLRTR